MYMKTCSNPNCSQMNPQLLDRFYKKGKNSDKFTARCIKCTNEQTDAWVARNREKKRAASVNWNHRNQEKHAENSRMWKHNNPGKANAATMRRIAAKKQATPPWLTKEQYKEIQNLYVEAARLKKETGIPYEVDHIEPLQGNDIRGLHVPWNLRIVHRSVNRRKNNKRSAIPQS